MIRRRQLLVGWVTPSVHDEAMEVFRRYADYEFSVVNGASFVAARRKGVRDVFGFDPHFATMGLVLRPA